MTMRAFLLCIAAFGAAAAQADDARQQRARIAAERAEVNAAFAARDAECRQRFVVTSCVNEARRQQRDALDRLHRQQLLLDEGLRRERAAQRVDAIRGKSVPADGGPRKPPAPPDAVLHLRQPTPPKAAPSHLPKPAPARSPEAHVEAAEKARQVRVRELRGKQVEIQTHREAVAKRDAQRVASGKKPSAPLPVPPTGSAPR